VVDFAGAYSFRNYTAEPQVVTYTLRFPAEQAIYNGLVMDASGQSLAIVSNKEGATATATLPPQSAFCGASPTGRMAPKAGTIGSPLTWARPASSLFTPAPTSSRSIFCSTRFPTTKSETPAGWDLTWRYTDLISGFQIGITMPEKLQPGRWPAKSAISGRFRYSCSSSSCSSSRRCDRTAPMNYFFLAAAFFLVPPAAGLSGGPHRIHIAFLICSVVSVFLVVSYLRLAVGPRFALIEAGGVQFAYLVPFSYAFIWQGYTGLAITAGCIVTLFLVMHMTARIRWPERFARRPVPVSAMPGAFPGGPGSSGTASEYPRT
jgi:hypothetical protein